MGPRAMTADLDETADRIALLSTWLAPRLTTEQMAWLEDQVTRIRNAPGGPALPMAIGLAPRRLGKADLSLDERETQPARALRPGLDPTGWSVDQTARILFVLASFDGEEDAFAENLRRLLAHGEVSEHIALLRGLPLCPNAARLVPIATEGLRSNVQPVFEAVAHASPFPRETFSKDQWNQMVLKALFVGSRLAPIQGLDERRNPELAEMLIDYAHERWAAGRNVSPELWRCVGPFARAQDLDDLAKVLRDGGEAEKTAAALALSQSDLPAARDVLSGAPALAAAIDAGRLAWPATEA
jgi:hypothetical protein